VNQVLMRRGLKLCNNAMNESMDQCFVDELTERCFRFVGGFVRFNVVDKHRALDVVDDDASFGWSVLVR
jgi:hypothetical protein